MAAQIRPEERRALLLACLCYFLLLGSYYVLRPIRDTMATVLGSARLQDLFTATFIGTLIASPIYTALASRVALRRLLPGVFWFWLLNVLIFAALLRSRSPGDWVASIYFVWFSVFNLFMISVFWSFMVDLFSASQSTRLFALIAAAGELGAIAGPLLTRLSVSRLGLTGLLLLVAAALLLVIALIHALMRAKQELQAHSDQAQRSTLEHRLSGNPFEGFGELLRSPYARRQALFILLMTWVNTIAYFLQTDLVSRSSSALLERAQAIADIDLAVNLCTAAVLLFGVGRLLQRFGVTAGLLANPVLMVVAFLALALAPSLFMIQTLQVVRRVAQYALARPSREICFTVVPQHSRYKAKNVIDTVVYRFGDLSSAWMQTGLRAAGSGLHGAIAAGIGASLVWGAVAALLGRRYERLRDKLAH
ncbi:MAG TPA: MFS transporter [Steroidobacteraceae bacterium]